MQIIQKKNLKYSISEEMLKNVEVPKATASYSPVNHGDIIDEIQESLYKNNLTISNKTYLSANGGKQVIAKYIINSDDNEMQRQIIFRNSYDKTMSLAFVTGAEVIICSNGMIVGDSKIVRKHTGSIVTEIKNKIVSSINDMDTEFKKLQHERELLKTIPLDLKGASEILGKMFIQEKIISANQLSAIANELYFSENFKMIDPKEPTTVWHLYNNCTRIFRNSHPTNYIRNHKNMHKYIMSIK